MMSSRSMQKPESLFTMMVIPYIIAPEDCKAKDGHDKFQFGGSRMYFVGVKNYKSGSVEFIAGYNDTKAIVEQCKGKEDKDGILGAPAAEAAWNYKANGFDNLQWYLPSVSELHLIYRYKDKINRFLSRYFLRRAQIEEWHYWSSTAHGQCSSWYVVMYNGYTNTYLRTGGYRVRAVAVAE